MTRRTGFSLIVVGAAAAICACGASTPSASGTPTGGGSNMSSATSRPASPSPSPTATGTVLPTPAPTITSSSSATPALDNCTTQTNFTLCLPQGWQLAYSRDDSPAEALPEWVTRAVDANDKVDYYIKGPMTSDWVPAIRMVRHEHLVPAGQLRALAMNVVRGFTVEYAKATGVDLMPGYVVIYSGVVPSGQLAGRTLRGLVSVVNIGDNTFQYDFTAEAQDFDALAVTALAIIRASGPIIRG